MTDFYLEKNISPDNKARIAGNACDLIDRLTDDKRWKISVKENKETRSQRSNRYLWGVVYATIRNHVMDSKGDVYTVEEIHEHYKHRFLIPEVKTVMGKEMKLYRTTTKMTKKEFSDYLELVIYAAAEIGCVVPPPDFQWRVAA